MFIGYSFSKDGSSEGERNFVAKSLTQNQLPVIFTGMTGEVLRRGSGGIGALDELVIQPKNGDCVRRLRRFPQILRICSRHEGMISTSRASFDSMAPSQVKTWSFDLSGSYCGNAVWIWYERSELNG